MYDKVTVTPLFIPQIKYIPTSTGSGTYQVHVGLWKKNLGRVTQKSTRNHLDIFRFNQPLPTEADWEYFASVEYRFQLQLIFLTHGISQWELWEKNCCLTRGSSITSSCELRVQQNCTQAASASPRPKHRAHRASSALLSKVDLLPTTHRAQPVPCSWSSSGDSWRWSAFVCKTS